MPFLFLPLLAYLPTEALHGCLQTADLCQSLGSSGDRLGIDVHYREWYWRLSEERFLRYRYHSVTQEERPGFQAGRFPGNLLILYRGVCLK